MPEIPILGVPVNFPFTPYDSQKDFMSKVIEALQKNQNALLESPTGTGKTLCLLCASLAWLETHQAHLQFQMSQSIASGDDMQRLEEQLKSGNGTDIPGFGNSRVRIIYASRTHTQLSQVMNELKRTSYSRFRTAIIASRDQLCIHPGVSKETSNQAKQAACRVKVQTRQCHFYNNVERKKDVITMHNPNDSQSNILDIEDLKVLGNKHKCCPYYVTRAAAKEYADIIFMPYNYLIDVAIRKRHGIELEGSIVIFDEAHNLAQVAEESSSVELSATDITSTLEELDAMLTYLENYGKEELENDNFLPTADDNLNFELLTLENVAKVKGLISNLEKEVMGIKLTNGELKASGDFMFELLAKTNLGFTTYLPIYQIVDACIAYFTGGGYSGVHNKAYGLSKFLDFLKVIFESDSYNISKSPEMRKAHIAQFYRVYVHNRDPPKKSFWNSSSASKDPVRVLSFWCFSPGFSMTDLQKQGVRCILLTSGTLKPLASLSSELRIPFPVTLENPHVISPSQISVSVVKQGPESVVLNSNYQNRSDPKYHTSLGYAIMQIAKAVPNGMLVFFPSYSVMRSIIESWNNGHLMQCIQRYKQVYIEPTNKEEFQQAMEQYYAMVNDATANGAIFCGVCRGKVSEGLDFVDKNGRAVVITGIPYAPAKDPKVLMKRSYLDQQLRNSTQKQTLTGSQWYNQQASRAVNQAIGRVIRHRFDYGAILLLDTRFSSSYARDELPEWVKANLVVHEAFSSVIRMLNKFFSTVPAEVEARKAQAMALEPAKPSGLPKVSISDGQTISSKMGISARSLYSSSATDNNKPAEEVTEVTISQPARKKIKMQMIPGIVDRVAPTPTEPNSSLKEVTNTSPPPSQDDKNVAKLKLASEALHKCRQLLSKEKFTRVKSSLLKYHKSKDINDIQECISVLLEQEATHSVISRFRDLISARQQECFDNLERQLRSTQGQTDAISTQTLSTQTPSISLSQTKSRYAATLSLFNDCKKKLSKDQNKIVKAALLAYKHEGSVEQLYNAINSSDIEDSPSLLHKLRGALRSSDLATYDRLLDDSSVDDITAPLTSTQCNETDGASVSLLECSTINGDVSSDNSLAQVQSAEINSP